MLNKIFEKLDRQTQTHSKRTAQLCLRLCSYMDLPKQSVETIHEAALYHDIGKINTPEQILFKPGRLTCSEFDIIKHHPEDGCRILCKVLNPEILEIIRCHHENEDGTGYYHCGSVPVGAKILRICDVYDALSEKRSYKKPWTQTRIFDFLTENSGTLFNAQLVGAFIQCLQKN